tara:strand:- start:810 stop:1025 length:216 start_codon:yes stop_codon:yes gene_type:complete
MAEFDRREKVFNKIRAELGEKTDPKTDAILSALEYLCLELQELNLAGAKLDGIASKLDTIIEDLHPERHRP